MDPKVAFRPQFRMRDPYTAELKVEIAPGYYLYRDRLRVEFIEYNAPAGAEKNNKLPAKPQGKIKTLPTTKGQMLALSLPNGRLVDDPTFGRVAIFEKNVTVLVDLARFNLADKNSKLVRESIKLALVSQGCAAVGVCFPPQKQSFTMPLNAPNKVDNWVFPQSETTMRFSQSGLDRGGSSLGGGIVKPVLRN
ncbi:MAG: protein-disulfide reductase DsbD N-terminal domain-containing protein [Pseudomonadota bacterium]